MYNDDPPASADTSYNGLTSDSILDALTRAGLIPDSRMFALSSYENRVYQAGVEDSMSVIVKSYRLDRWIDAQVAEEHAFTAELAAAEIPMVAPLEIDDRTLHASERWYFAVFPYCTDRVPAIDQDHILEWMGRFLGCIHVMDARRPLVARPALDIDTSGV